MKPVKSLYELQKLCKTDSVYRELAVTAATNLGYSPSDYNEALRHLSEEAAAVELEHGNGAALIVDEVNFCIDM